MFIPFNNQPVSVSTKTGSYTIPAGSYARITATVSCSSNGEITITGNGGDPNDIFMTSDVADKTASFWVPTGTILDTATTSSNTTTSGVSSTALLLATDSAEAKVTIDAADGIKVNTRATCMIANGTSSGTDYVSANVINSAQAAYVVELYNELT